MSKRLYLLGAFAGLCVCAGWFASRRAEPPVATPAPEPPQRVASAPAAPAGAKPSSGDAEPFGPGDVTCVALFQENAHVFSTSLATRLGLTADQQAALWVIAWESRRKMNQLICDRAVISHPSERETVMAFKLDPAEVSELRRELYDSVHDTVGETAWPAVRQSVLLKELEQAMDYWGESETAYSFKPVQTANGTVMVTMDTVRAAALPVTISRQYRLSTFVALYGPVARKIGFGPTP